MTQTPTKSFPVGEKSKISSLGKRMLRTVKPPTRMTVSEWADRYRYLPSESAAEAGKWRTDRAEYLRGPMDAFTDPSVWMMAVMKSAQTGFTELILNTIGYRIDRDPGPGLAVYPTDGLAEVFSKDRLSPSVRDSPRLREKVADPKGRDSGNTIYHKKYPGGQLAIVSAQSPSELAGRPVRDVWLDEVDRMPASAGSEGDPIDLATARTKTFWNRKIVLVSTPTIKGLSRIDKAYEESDKRVFEVPCPHCGHHHVLRWGNVVWNKDTPAKGDAAKAMIQCPSCHGFYSNAQKNAAVRKGRWVATAPFKGIAGFWINEIYSPWTTVAEMATRWYAVKDDPARLQVFVNTALAECWDGEGETISDADLLARSEKFAAAMPARALVLTAGVDTQPDRLEVEIVGWGAGEESWSIDYRVIYGDPDIAEGQAGSPWDILLDLLRKPVRHEWGVDVAISATCIDTGGHNTQAVYGFVKRHKFSKIFGVKGRGGAGIPIVSSPQRKRTGKVKRPIDLFTVGVDQAKDTIVRRLAIKEAGPGFCHFPFGRDGEWFRQLTAEKRVTKYKKGFPRREWVKADGRRNEALDCRVYAFAAFVLAAPQLDKVALRLRRDRDALSSKTATATAKKITTPTMDENGKITRPAPEAVPEAAPDDTDTEAVADDPPAEKTQQDPPGESAHDTTPESDKPKKRTRQRVPYMNRW